MKFAQVTTGAATLMALSVHYAAAAPASVTTKVNLRQGPGTTYNVVASIPGGAAVDVGDCKGQWCQVTWHGQNGYVIATSLVQPDVGGPASGGAAPPPGAPPPGATAGGPPPGYDAPPPGYVPPPAYYSYYGYGPYYSYGPYYYGGYGYRHGRW